MTEFTLGGYRLLVDVEATRAYYAAYNEPWITCECDGCRNFAQAVKDLPQAVKDFFDALGLSFDVTMRELEYIRWCATEPIFPMEGIEDFLALCAELGIRTGVISNLSFSGPTLVRRINECLPFHRFEFIVASSECVFRKPSEHIFRRALGLAGLDAASCWFAGDDVECDVEGAARSGLYPVWFKCPLKCTYKPEAPHTPRCEYLKVASWAELGEILRGLE